jgi:hypothetical protein
MRLQAYINSGGTRILWRDDDDHGDDRRGDFAGLVALSRVIRWDGDGEQMFDRTLSPEQID